LSGYIFATKARIDNQKNLLKTNSPAHDLSNFLELPLVLLDNEKVKEEVN